MASGVGIKPNYAIHMNHPTANLAMNRKQLHKLVESEKKALLELRKLHFETAHFEIELHRSIFAIEEGTDAEYHKIYEERKKILQQFRGTEGDKINSTRPLRNFWLRVLKAADIEINPEKDEKILQHLIDVRSKMFVDPRVKMVIEFEFEENEYFSNKLLTKTYYIKCDADPKDAIIYDGIEITSMQGCKINWLIERGEAEEIMTEDNHIPSFFEYFNDHTESEHLNRALLSEEIAFGFFLREKVIPKAVYFFTGEIRGEKEENSDESEHESLDGDSNIEGAIAAADDDERTETGDDETYDTCSERPEDELEQEAVKEYEKVKAEKMTKEEMFEEEKEKEERKMDLSEFKELTEFEEDLLELLEEAEYEDAITDDVLCLVENTEDMDKELQNTVEKEDNEKEDEEKAEETNVIEDDDNKKFIETVEDLAKHVMVNENICLHDSKSFLRVSESTTRKLTLTEEMSRVVSRALLEEKVKSEYKKD